MKFKYHGRLVEASSRDEAVRRIAEGARTPAPSMKHTMEVVRELRKIRRDTQLTSLSLGSSWGDVWSHTLKVSDLGELVDASGVLHVIPFMSDMDIPEHAEIDEQAVKALDGLLGSRTGDNAYRECIVRRDGRIMLESGGFVQVDVMDWFDELVIDLSDSSARRKAAEYAAKVNAKLSEVQRRLDALFGSRTGMPRIAESKSTYRRPVEERDGGKDPDFKETMRGLTQESLAKKVRELKEYVEQIFAGATDGVTYDVAIGGNAGAITDSTYRRIAGDLLDSRRNGMYGLDVVYAWVDASLVLPDGDREATYGGLVTKYLGNSPAGTRAEIDDDILPGSDIGLHDLTPSAPDLDVIIEKGLEGAKAEYRKYADAIVAQVENDRIPELREAFKKAKAEHEAILSRERKMADDADKYQARMRRGRFEGQGDPLSNPGRFQERRLENNKRAAVDLLNGIRGGAELTFSMLDADGIEAGSVTLDNVEKSLGSGGSVLYVGPTSFDLSVPSGERLTRNAMEAILRVGYYDSPDDFKENGDGTWSASSGVYRANVGPYTSSLEVDLSKPDAVNRIREYVSRVNKELDGFQRKVDAIVRSAQKYAREVGNNPVA